MLLPPASVDTSTADGPDEALSRAELLRIGDRLVAFTVLLPRVPSGEVALLVAEPLASALAHRFPAARRGRQGPSEADGNGCALVIVEEGYADPDAARALLAPDGVLAVLGRRGRYVIYPDAAAPQHVWRRGWPLPGAVGGAADLRRRAGVLLHGLRSATCLDVRGPAGPSLADEVAAAVGVALDDTFTVVGIVAAGHIVLRLRGRREIAVRLSCGDSHSDPVRSERVAADVPAAAPLLPEVLAHGRLGGMPWAATPWLPARGVPVLDGVRRSRAATPALGLLAELLAGCPTGRTSAGWAAAWVDACTLVPAERRDRFVTALAVLEGGVPTGWCHGDPWAGNVLVGPGGPVVIDWDTAAPDAPLGLDRLLLLALERAQSEGTDMVTACAVFARQPALLDADIGGHAWVSWSPRERAALALAAALLHLRNRALHDLGHEGLRGALGTLSDLLSAPMDTDPATEPEIQPEIQPEIAPQIEPEQEGLEAPATRGAGRGALWLAAGAIATKTYQTIIQLVLAAVLAPSALGVLAVGALVTNVVSTLTDMGSSTALVHWRGDPRQPARSALTVALGTSLLATVLGWLLAPWLSATLGAGHDGVGVIRGLLLCVPLYSVANVSLELMRRDLAFARRVTPDIASAAVGLGVSVVLVLHGAGVYALVVGQVAGASLRMLACWVLAAPVRPGWSLAHVRELLAYGRHLAGANAVQLLMLNVDYLLIGHLLGAGPLGQYSLAFRLAYMPHLMVTVVVCGAAFPYLCRLRSDEVAAAVSLFGRLLAALLAPVYVAMLLLAPAIELLGTQWAPAVPVLRWLAAYGLLLSVVQVAQTTFNAVGRTRLTFVLNIAHLVVLAGLLWLLVPTGITAAGIAQAVAGAAVAILAVGLLLRVVSRTAPVGWLVRDVATALAGLLAMAAVCIAVRAALPDIAHSLLSALVLGCLMMLAYAGVLVAGLGRRRVLALAGTVMSR
ncbi:MAG: oligosaccharide flippase family protein [Marmoricola sp.]